MSVVTSNAINATLLREPQLQLHSRYRPGREHRRRLLCHGGQSVDRGQDPSRVHRLCQGQSGQDQHGFDRQRDPDPCLRRAVQDDGRRRLASRPLSRRVSLPDLLGGQVQVVFGPICPSRSSCIQAGKLRALAVTTSGSVRRRCRTSRPWLHFVPGYEASVRYGIGAPRNTPAEIVDRLNKEINAGLADPKMKARLPTWRHSRCR